MPRVEKVKINVKERLEDNTLDLSMSNLTEVPIKDIVRINSLHQFLKSYNTFFYRFLLNEPLF